MAHGFASPSSKAIPIHVVEKADLSSWIKGQSKLVKTWVEANGFLGTLGSVCLVPEADGSPQMAVVGWGDAKARTRGRLFMGDVALKLPKGNYEIKTKLAKSDLEECALAWRLAEYAFDRYTEKKGAIARLKAPKSIDAERIDAQVAGDFLARDLINTPASDMGPDELEKAFKALAKTHKAKVKVIKGDALLKQNFPMIHAVGRASDQAPRLLDMIWGKAGDPLVTLVGKGVCFDTGGLNIKPGSSMGLMKKDMGGSATTLGLAHMIMALGLKVRLRVLVPAVENSISAGAYRPQDILTSRKGPTVEINNTDAEGRLVLADALALADEESPDLLVCMATLTGAARVAMGPDVPPFFTDDDKLADTIGKTSMAKADPLWRLPFWDPYEAMIEPDVADLDNAPSGGFGGCITAALFLRRFVDSAKSFVHLDLYGWAPAAKPARTKGGACQSARVMLEVIEKEFSR